jgi:hypothetical protein
MALVAMLLLMACASQLSAQLVDTNQFVIDRVLRDTTWARRPTFGIDTNDFWYGGVIGTPVPGNTVAGYWTLARYLGLKILERRTAFDAAGYLLYDGLIEEADPDSNERVIVNGGLISSTGWAREIILYPFDSSQSLYWNSIFRMPDFASRPGGDTINSEERDHAGGFARERVYESANTTAGDTILKQVAFGYDSVFQLRRYPGPAYDENVENSSAFLLRNELATRAAGLAENQPVRSRYFAVRGHLFEFGAANDTDTLLLLDIYNEIPKGTEYLNSSGVVDSDTSQNLEILYTTLAVTKADLKPTGTPPDYNRYVEKSFNVDLVRLQPTTGMGGPLNPNNTAHRFDLRVRWTGKEKVALRSINLRDSAAEMLLGQGTALATARHNFRVALEHEADRIMRGPLFNPGIPNDTNTTNSVRDDRMGRILRFYTGDEAMYEMCGTNYIDTFLFHRFPNLTPNTLTRGMRGYRAQGGSNGRGAEMLHGTGTSENEISVELYFFEGPEHRAYDPEFASRFGLPYHIPRAPSLKEENGGRFGIPLLNIDSGNVRDSVDIFSRAMQRQSIGAYAPGGYFIWPLDRGVNHLGHGALVARRTGRRLILWPGVFSSLQVKWGEDPDPSHYALIDTQFSHLPTCGDERMLAGLAICYGSGGLHLGWVGSDPNEFGSRYKTLGGDSVLFNYVSDFGPAGPLTSDITSDTLPTYVLENTDRFPAHRVEIPHFWTGWKSRSEEIRRLTTEWIPGLWPTLRRLRWRDAYSIHFTALQTWYDPPTGDLDTLLTRQRLLDTNEIIRDITAWGREYRQFAHDTGFYFTRPDSATNTFVEVGLFDRLPGPNGYDTNAIMIVNRRTFERPAVVPRTSTRGRIMDSLADVRQIRFHLNNLHHPDTSHQYTWFRIVEVGADTVHIPVMSPGVEVSRTGLDTILHVDSLVSLTLRSGGSALLMIFPVGPDTNIYTGGLAYNNGRSMIFDGARYHCVYTHYDTIGPGGHIFYRRSIPVSPENASILWEPTEAEISDRMGDQDTSTARMENRTPSLTLRVIEADTAVVVTWSCLRPNGMSQDSREVVLRTFVPRDVNFLEYGPIESVDTCYGSRDGQWGTPVVSRLATGYIVAFADSLNGLVARYRPLAGPSDWWHTPVAWSPRHIVDGYAIPRYGSRIQFPTMPAFAHIAALDSNVGIAWQSLDGPTGYSNIFYKHLWVVADTIIDNNLTRLNLRRGFHRHPSMDLWQDFHNHAYEGVVWEEDENPAPQHTIRLYFQPLATRAESYDANAASNPTVFWDHPDSTKTWQWTKIELDQANRRWFQTPDYAWPSTASMNEVIDYPNQFDTNHFAIAWVDSTRYNNIDTTWENAQSVHQMMQWRVYFGNAETVDGYPHDYQYDGYRPTLSSSPVRQDLRGGTLYTMNKPSTGNGVISTSRQFFGKTRPVGYLAEGRSLVFRVNDSSQTTIGLRLIDAWYADDTVAASLRLKPRGASSQSIDSIAQARDLFETIRFTTHDSVTIGFEVMGDFRGDSSVAASAEVFCQVQLIDSATGNVVQVLDSFAVSAADTLHRAVVETECDLLSGTYYLRMVIDTAGFIAEPSSIGSHYPVDELFRRIEEPTMFGKVRRLQGEATASKARIDLHPNPSIGLVEIRFSIPTTSHVTVHVVDQRGVDVLIPVQTTMMESGRYAVALDGSRLVPGVYLVELRAGKERVVEKMVITR